MVVRVRGADEFNDEGQSLSEWQESTFGKKGQNLINDFQRNAAARANAFSNFSLDFMGGVNNAFDYVLNTNNAPRLAARDRKRVEDRPDWLSPPVFRAKEKTQPKQGKTNVPLKGDFAPPGARQAQDAVYANRARAAEEAKPEQSFADFMSMAASQMGGGPDFGSIRARLQQGSAESDARLAAMFQQLNDSFAANTPVIGAIYDQAGTELQKNATEASNLTTSGFNAARDAQTQQFAALGIQDAAAVLGQNGEAAADQTLASSNLAREQAAQLNANTARRATGQKFNVGMQGSAALGGAEARVQNQRSLLDNLSNLAFRESENAVTRNDMQASIARDLQKQAMGEAPDPEMEMKLAQFIASQQQTAFENSAKTQRTKAKRWAQLLESTDYDFDRAKDLYAQEVAAGFI